MKIFPNRKIFRLAALAGVAAIVVAGAVFYEVSTAVVESRELTAQAGRIAFQRSRLSGGTGRFEEIPVRPSFRDAAYFAEDVWLAGRRGVYRFNPQGELKQLWRSGYELPPSAPVRLRPGLDPLSSRPALFAATAGDGLLLFFEDGSVDAVRAEEQPFRDLTEVLSLASGRVLLGTQQRGVLAYDGDTLTPYHPQLASGHVTALEGDESALWIGSLDAGVALWAGGALTRLGVEQGLPDAHVLSLALGGDSAYVGGPTGAAEIRGGRVTRTFADGFFANALMLRDGNLHVGTLDEGLAEVSLETTRRSAPATFLDEPSRIERLLEIEGHAYALAPSGLFPLDGSRGALTPDIGLLTDGNVSAIHADSDGRLWVGYFDRGLDILDSQFQLAAHVEDDTVFCINRLAEGPHGGSMLAATANGLATLDSGGRIEKVLRRDDGLLADHVTDIVVDGDSVTIATPAGLTFYGPGGAQSVYALQGLVNNHVYALGRRGSTLLAGTLGGLSVLEGGRVDANYTTANSDLGHHWISAVVDFQGSWFVGTYGAGVWKLDSAGRWSSWPEMQGVEINPNAMAKTDRTMLAGALDGGLLLYDPQSDQWREIRDTSGRNVTALEARNGMIYLGTSNGLARISEEDLMRP